MSLVDRSLAENDHTVVSIFINPTQFDNAEDFAKYPVTLEQDRILLEEKRISALLLPTASAVYPTGQDMRVIESEMSALLCGAHRPGHFQGMLTVVLKLFGIVQPTRAYFGEKDFQQALLVEKLVDTFFIPVDIVRVPTVRDSLGIAMSSRNQRLTSDQLQHLAHFPKILRQAQSDEEATEMLTADGFKVDYVTTWMGFRHSAVHLNGVRFIDHVEV
jgi:pantoate--beta-alanine ligase